MTRQVWSATRPSISHPERNEDNLWIAANVAAAAAIDGMGSYRRRTPEGEVGGEHASALAARLLAESLDGWPEATPLDEAKQRARAAIETVNTRIFVELNLEGNFPVPEGSAGEVEASDKALVGIALTLALFCDGGTRLLVAQHGDTRAYVLKTAGLFQITEDQDRLAWDLAQGRLDPDGAAAIGTMLDQFDGVDVSHMTEEALGYLLDKRIFGSLGDEAETPETVFSVFRLDPGDRVALLSDGTHDNLMASEIESLVAYPDNPAQMLVDLAYQRSQMRRLPDPNSPGEPYNMRATADDATAIVIQC